MSTPTVSAAWQNAEGEAVILRLLYAPMLLLQECHERGTVSVGTVLVVLRDVKEQLAELVHEHEDDEAGYWLYALEMADSVIEACILLCEHGGHVYEAYGLVTYLRLLLDSSQPAKAEVGS